jgi:hypothetical protein
VSAAWLELAKQRAVKKMTIRPASQNRVSRAERGRECGPVCCVEFFAAKFI